MGKIGRKPKIGQLWRPVAPQPYSLALVQQHGVNSISLQCIPWPVACSEWDACLTDFDRSSTFRFSGSGIQTMIQIGLKSWSVRPCPDICRHAKFHPNPCTRFLVILLTNRQTSQAIAYTPPLSEVMIISKLDEVMDRVMGHLESRNYQIFDAKRNKVM